MARPDIYLNVFYIWFVMFECLSALACCVTLTCSFCFVRVCMKAGVCAQGPPDSVLCSENIADVYNVLLSSMNDYTLDSRGDVGAWWGLRALFNTSENAKSTQALWYTGIFSPEASGVSFWPSTQKWNILLLSHVASGHAYGLTRNVTWLVTCPLQQGMGRFFLAV